MNETIHGLSGRVFSAARRRLRAHAADGTLGLRAHKAGWVELGCAGAALALGAVAVLQRLHAGHHEAHEPGPLVHWLRDGALAVPLAVVAILVATPLAGRLAVRARLLADGGGGSRHGVAGARLLWALTGAALFALLSVPGNEAHARLFGAHDVGLSFAAHAARDASAVLLSAFALLLLLTIAMGAPWEGRYRSRLERLGSATVRAVPALVLTGALLVAAPAVFGAETASPATCSAATAARAYDVAAINVPIPFNRFGDVLEHGAVYVLEQDKAAVKNWHVPLAADPGSDPAGNRRLRPRPLVLRANAGECVAVTLTNELDAVQNEALPNSPRASMHVEGLAFSANSSDGSMVGYNADSTVAPGSQITYFWVAPDREGLYQFRDLGVPGGSEHDAGLAGTGLFGAFVVEPPGSTYTDPVSGNPLYTGTQGQSGELYIGADIHPGSGRSFRESVQLAWDEIPGLGQEALGFNYATEIADNRNAERCPDCVAEETALSSWPYGDPGLAKLASGLGPWLPNPGGPNPEDCGLVGVSCWTSSVIHTYKGDPVKIRYGHAGTKETHVFHLHAHQWLAEPDDFGAAGPTPGQPSDANRPESTTIDSQTFGPGEAFTADLLFGAGSKPGTIGDSIFHCHLYPHFVEGFWALLRVHDVRERGLGQQLNGVSDRTPDEIGVNTLRLLAGGGTPPDPTATNPGFPRFIPGQVGWRAPQPPGSITVGGPTGPLAPRTVAGAELTLADTAVERAVQELHYGVGNTPKLGAPITNPCPAGSREVTYNVSVIQTDIVYNEAGWHDTMGRILVLDRDVAAIAAGTKKPEPLFVRVNAGDCVNFNLTNRLPHWFGGDAFVQLQQTNMVGEHIHLVKFDVLGSDGSSNGWNYQQAAFSEEQHDFVGDVLGGTATCNQAGCRLEDAPVGFDPIAVPDVAPGQTIHERWYADYELRTVFTHDHHFPAVDQNRGLFGALLVEPSGFDTRDPVSGTYFQPVNSAAHGTPCGSACEGTAAGAIVDMVGPGASDDFREFGLGFQDFLALTRAGGDPRNPAHVFNPPPAPEPYPDADPGVMGINYRNAPFALRQRANGSSVDPAFVFSSFVFGDPRTPLLQAYRGDKVRIRLIQGSQEEQHQFFLHGFRWRNEPDDAGSAYVASRPLGVSEAFNFEVPGIDCGGVIQRCKGDFLYGSAATDDMYLGMWGLFRVFYRPMRINGAPPLRGLPDYGTPGATVDYIRPPPGTMPPAQGPNSPCPSSAPVKSFEVTALQVDLKYNAAGDHDPYGLAYVPSDQVAAVKAGRKPEPLVLRANEGDCVTVRLTNRLTSSFRTHAGAADGDPKLPTEPPAGTRGGLRVSLHPQLVDFHVFGSDGSAVGYNHNSTVGPNDSIVYRWFLPDISPGELGTVPLLDYGDLRAHRHHGLFAALVVEPRGATYHDRSTGKAISSGAVADIRLPGAPDFRELVVFNQDGLNLRRASGPLIGDAVGAEPGGETSFDAEDSGEKGYNYTNAPFARRLGYSPEEPQPLLSADQWAHVFSSLEHGDPSTPIFRVYEGDRVRIRVVQGADRPRQNTLTVSGAGWLSDPGDPKSRFICAIGGLTVGSAANLEFTAGPRGDYLYGSRNAHHHLSGGMWGIMRVYTPPAGPIHPPDSLLLVDNPFTADYRPIRVLDPPPPVAVPAAPAASWTSTVGTTSGLLGSTGADDDVFFDLVSANVFGSQVVDGFGTWSVPAGQRDVVSMVVTWNGRSTRAGLNRKLRLFNWQTNAWEEIHQAALSTTSDVTSTTTVSGDPSRFVSPTGDIRVRVDARWSTLTTYRVKVDQLTLAYSYQQ